VTLNRFLVAWRTIPVRDREVVDALVHPDHAGPSPELSRALAEWPGTWYWSDENGARHLVLTRPRAGLRRERWLMPVTLFLAGGDVQTVPMVIYGLIAKKIITPRVNAMSTIVLLLSLVFVVVATRLGKRGGQLFRM